MAYKWSENQTTVTLQVFYSEQDNRLCKLETEHKANMEDYSELQVDYDTLTEQLHTVQEEHEELLQRNKELSALCDMLRTDVREAESRSQQLEGELGELSIRLQHDQLDGTEVSVCI